MSADAVVHCVWRGAVRYSAVVYASGAVDLLEQQRVLGTGELRDGTLTVLGSAVCAVPEDVVEQLAEVLGARSAAAPEGSEAPTVREPPMSPERRVAVLCLGSGQFAYGSPKPPVTCPVCGALVELKPGPAGRPILAIHGLPPERP